MDPFDDATEQEKMTALASALRRREDLGQLFQLTGDRVLAPLGQNLMASADRGEQRLEAGQQRRLQLGLEARREATQEEHQRKMEGFEGQRLNLARQNAAEERGRPFAGEDLATGARQFYRLDKTGNPVPLGVGAPKSALADLGTDRLKARILGDLGKDLDPNAGKASLPAQAQAAINAAERVETLLQSPGPITPQRIEELTIMAATVANGGKQPTEAQVKGMLPKTFKGEIADWAQYITANPTDAGAQGFLEQVRQQSEREKATASAQIRRAHIGKLVKHSTAFQMFPEEAARIAEGAGLKGMYDASTLLGTQTVDPVAEAAKAGHETKKPVKYLVSPDKKRRIPIYADKTEGPEEPNQ